VTKLNISTISSKGTARKAIRPAWLQGYKEESAEMVCWWEIFQGSRENPFVEALQKPEN